MQDFRVTMKCFLRFKVWMFKKKVYWTLGRSCKFLRPQNSKISGKYQWYHSIYWTPGSNRKGPIESLRPSICPPVLPSFSLSGRFLGIVSLIFSKFWYGARTPCEVVCDRARFSRKIFFAPKIDKMGQKQGFFNLLECLVINFLLNLTYNENLYYLLCSCTNTMLQKTFFQRYRPKCSQPIRLQDFLINHISRTNQ